MIQGGSLGLVVIMLYAMKLDIMLRNDWENESLGENSEHLAFFVSRIQESFPHQHISEPTRYRFGEEPNLLDLVLTNEEGMVRNLEYQSGLGNSDHFSLIFELVCQEEKNKDTGTQADFFKTDPQEHQLGDKLSRNFAESYEIFMVIVTTAIDKYVPKRTMRHRKKYSIYTNNEAMALKNKMQRLWKK